MRILSVKYLCGYIKGKVIKAVLEILVQSIELTLKSSFLSKKSIVCLTWVPFSSQEGFVAVVTLHVLYKVYFQKLYSLLGFITRKGTVKLEVMNHHDQAGAGIHRVEK